MSVNTMNKDEVQIKEYSFIGLQVVSKLTVTFLSH